MMIETRQPVKDAENFQGTWLKTREIFGALVEAETLKNVALQGFQEFGRGVARQGAGATVATLVEAKSLSARKVGNNRSSNF